ncbi:MAG: hypothetical protein ISN26_01070 [Betaproteobacteria bacterium AqS2]|uniref:PEGA domain-containing protein n=1 Tax=Candidatus Amphirhobacter heronislandensis TaxID=1732024 RepID=A0A930UBT0_9GAMM|nr:hypothetical protein [Betaproteobacteria bacterium AqS2]
MRKTAATLLLACVALAGCTSLRDGYYQAVTVTTEPPNATCKFAYDDGVPFSTVTSGEPAYNIRRSYKDIYVTCGKRGYADAQKVLPAGINRENNRFFIWGLGLDVLTQSNRAYPTELHIDLTPN